MDDPGPDLRTHDPSRVAMPSNSAFCHQVAFQDPDPAELWMSIKAGEHASHFLRQSPANAVMPKGVSIGKADLREVSVAIAQSLQNSRLGGFTPPRAGRANGDALWGRRRSCQPRQRAPLWG